MREGGFGGSSERRAFESYGRFLEGERSRTTRVLGERGVGVVDVCLRGLMKAGLSLRGLLVGTLPRSSRRLHRIRKSPIIDDVLD